EGRKMSQAYLDFIAFYSENFWNRKNIFDDEPTATSYMEYWAYLRISAVSQIPVTPIAPTSSSEPDSRGHAHTEDVGVALSARCIDRRCALRRRKRSPPPHLILSSITLRREVRKKNRQDADRVGKGIGDAVLLPYVSGTADSN
ncbi:hypothetical protein NQ317_002772, partial [Molorchus minor]